jgi:hypothetical protein
MARSEVLTLSRSYWWRSVGAEPAIEWNLGAAINRIETNHLSITRRFEKDLFRRIVFKVYGVSFVYQLLGLDVHSQRFHSHSRLAQGLRGSGVAQRESPPLTATTMGNWSRDSFYLQVGLMYMSLRQNLNRRPKIKRLCLANLPIIICVARALLEDPKTNKSPKIHLLF